MVVESVSIVVAVSVVVSSVDAEIGVVSVSDSDVARESVVVEVNGSCGRAETENTKKSRAIKRVDFIIAEQEWGCSRKKGYAIHNFYAC